MTNLRALVFAALDNVLANGYAPGETTAMEVAHDLYDRDADIAEALGVQADKPNLRSLVPFIEEWVVTR